MKNVSILIGALLCVFLAVETKHLGEKYICPELLIRSEDNGEPKKLGGDIECKGTEEQCEYGAVFDWCRICQVCTRGPGEQCGGYYGLAGTCGNKLTCTVPINWEYSDDKLFGECVPEA